MKVGLQHHGSTTADLLQHGLRKNGQGSSSQCEYNCNMPGHGTPATAWFRGKFAEAAARTAALSACMAVGPAMLRLSATMRRTKGRRAAGNSSGCKACCMNQLWALPSSRASLRPDLVCNARAKISLKFVSLPCPYQRHCRSCEQNGIACIAAWHIMPAQLHSLHMSRQMRLLKGEVGLRGQRRVGMIHGRVQSPRHAEPPDQ